MSPRCEGRARHVAGGRAGAGSEPERGRIATGHDDDRDRCGEACCGNAAAAPPATMSAPIGGRDQRRASAIGQPAVGKRYSIATFLASAKPDA